MLGSDRQMNQQHEQSLIYKPDIKCQQKHATIDRLNYMLHRSIMLTMGGNNSQVISKD
jgi:hypothetical protein